MSGRTTIPFGPQHPVLPEPLHLDLVTENETVIEAIPSIGRSPWVMVPTNAAYCDCMRFR